MKYQKIQDEMVLSSFISLQSPCLRRGVSKPAQMAALFLKRSREGVSSTSSVTHPRISCSSLPEYFLRALRGKKRQTVFVLGSFRIFYPMVQRRKPKVQAVSLSLQWERVLSNLRISILWRSFLGVIPKFSWACDMYSIFIRRNSE